MAYPGPIVELRIQLPKKLADKLEEIANKYGLEVQDLVIRAIDKVIRELG